MTTTVTTDPLFAVAPNFDQNKLDKFSKDLEELFGQINEIFPEREDFLQRIKFGLMTRENVLVHGVFGTAKTDICKTIFEAFEGVNTFTIALNKFSTESQVFGVPNPKKLRDEGKFEYDRAAGILDAQFLELDEMLDANEPILRAMLGILNEHLWKRGRQVEVAKLHTAIACTNGDPAKAVVQSDVLGAVLDRFLFQHKVNYLKEEEDQIRMLEKYASGARPTVKIQYPDLDAFSQIVCKLDQIKDRQLFEVHNKVVQGYKVAREKAGNPIVISDRRRCKLLKLIAANALLHGRFDPVLEDILAIQWGLFIGGEDPKVTETFRQVAEPLIEKAAQSHGRKVDDAEMKLLADYRAQMATLDTNCDESQLLALNRQILALRDDIAAVKPELTGNQVEQKKMIKAIDSVKAKVQGRIDGKGGK